MEIYSFTAFHLKSKGDISSFVAPPYDQIDKETFKQLTGRGRLNFVTFTRPFPPNEQTFHSSFAKYQQLKKEGKIINTEEPYFFTYSILKGRDTIKKFLIALVDVRDPKIYPHENTLDKPLQERIKHLETFNADLEPIYLLVEDKNFFLSDLLNRENINSRWLYAKDNKNQIHVVTPLKRSLIEQIKHNLKNEIAVIADGHHRFKAVKLYNNSSNNRWLKLAVIDSMRNIKNIAPIHRGVKTKIYLDLPITETVPYKDVEKRLQSILSSGKITVINKEKVILYDHPSTELPVETLNRAIKDVNNVLYEADITKLLKMLNAGHIENVILLPPLEIEKFVEKIKNKQLFPPKSTRFLPKPLSGFIWYEYGNKIL